MHEFDKIIAELIWTGISIYVLSIFIAFFDTKIGNFLKQISYLFAFSFLIILGNSVYITFNNLIVAINKLSESKVFKLFGGD